jgi:hypothetical protein
MMPFRCASQLVTQSETEEADEPEPIDASPDTSKVADTAYLDRFWSTLFANTDKGKTDESWIVTVSLDMSKWFISRLAKDLMFKHVRPNPDGILKFVTAWLRWPPALQLYSSAQQAELRATRRMASPVHHRSENRPKKI